MTIIIYITSRNRFLWDSCPRYHLSPAIPRLHRHSTGRLSDLGNPLALTQKGATCAGRLECCSWPFVDTFSSANCFWGMFTRMQGWVWCIPLKKSALNWWKRLSMKLGLLCSHHEMFEMSPWICCLNHWQPYCFTGSWTEPRTTKPHRRFISGESINNSLFYLSNQPTGGLSKEHKRTIIIQQSSLMVYIHRSSHLSIYPLVI
jgi:hypothetical protein